MPVSIIQYMTQRLQVIIKLLQCSRREQKLIASPNTTDIKLQEPAKASDCSNLSTDDLSETSGHTDSGTDGHSGDQWCLGETPLPFHCGGSLAPPPGLAAPPGLGLPSIAPTVPKKESNNLLALKEALDRLAPAEVATVQSLLSERLRDTGGTHAGCKSQHYAAGPSASYRTAFPRSMSNPGATVHTQEAAAWGSNAHCADVPRRRSFTPFQGSNGKQAVQFGTKQIKRAGAAEPEQPGSSLAELLRELSLFDDACVLSLRKISGLGLNSADLLQTYFSKFGTVERLMISHTRVKSKVPGGSTRVRPAALGFAVMSTAKEVENVLGFGAVHFLSGVEFSVGPFQSHSIGGGD